MRRVWRTTRFFSSLETTARRESIASTRGATRKQGHDAVAVTEAGLSGAPDAKVRAFAIETGRILVTLDADFPGVIRLKIHPATELAIREQIQRTLQALGDTSLVGRLVVSRGNVIRIRA